MLPKLPRAPSTDGARFFSSALRENVPFHLAAANTYCARIEQAAKQAASILVCKASPPEPRTVKPEPKRNPADRFRAPLRHYHRTNAEDPWDWEEWVDGRVKSRRWTWPRIRKVLGIAVAILGVAALIALAVGLVIELR